MAIQEENKNIKTYPYQAGVYNFDIPYPVSGKDDFKIYLGNDLLSSSDYNYVPVTGQASVYGRITLTPEGKAKYDSKKTSLKISRSVPITQKENFSSQASYGPATERGLDKLTLIAQDTDLRIDTLEDAINTWSYDKLLKIGNDEQIVSGEPNLVLPKDRKGKFLAFDDKGSVSPRADVITDGSVGNGLELNGTKLNVKAEDSTISVGSAGIKGNYIAGDGLGITNNKIDLKLDNSTLVVDVGNKVKATYTVGDGLSMSGTKISAKVDGDIILINSEGKISSNAVRRQDISTGLEYTKEGKLETVIKGIDEQSITHTFQNKLMCGKQTGKYELLQDVSDSGITSYPSYFFELSEEQSLYVFIGPSKIIVRKYNSNEKTWADLVTVNGVTSGVSFLTPAMKVTVDSSRLTFIVAESQNTTINGISVYRTICRLYEIKSPGGVYSCTELSNCAWDTEQYKYIDPKGEAYSADFSKYAENKVAGSYLKYGFVFNQRVSLAYADPAYFRFYQVFHMVKVNADYTVTHYTWEKPDPLYWGASPRYDEATKCRFEYSSCQDKLFIRSGGSSSARVNYCTFSEQGEVVTNFVQSNYDHNYDNNVPLQTFYYEGNIFILYSFLSGTMYLTRLASDGTTKDFSIAMPNSGTIKPVLIFNQLGVYQGYHNTLTIFEYDIVSSTFMQRYSFKYDSPADLSSRSFSAIGKVGSDFGIFTYTGNPYVHRFGITEYSIVNTYYTFMPTDREKFDTIEVGAEKNVQSDWTQTNPSANDFIKNRPPLSPVATSGDYNDLSNKPAVPTPYTLPAATSDILGGVKAGDNINISEDGTISSTGGGGGTYSAGNNIIISSDNVISTLKMIGTGGIKVQRSLEAETQGFLINNDFSARNISYLNGYYVAVGSSGSIYYTQDPLGAWYSSTISPSFSEDFKQVVYGNGYYVTIGGNWWSGGCVYYTTDLGSGWTNGQVFQKGFNSIAYGNGYFVAVGEGGDMYYTQDPASTWTQKTGFSHEFTGIEYVNNYFVAFRYGDCAYYFTSDPTGTWEHVKMYQGDTQTFRSIAYGGGYYIAIGDGRTAYSTALTNSAWIKTETDTMRNIIYCDGAFYAVGDSGRIQFTQNLYMNWRSAVSSMNSNFKSIIPCPSNPDFDFLICVESESSIYGLRFGSEEVLTIGY